MTPSSPPTQTVDHESEQRVGRAQTLLVSFRYAFAGVSELLWAQHQAKLHIILGLITSALGVVLGIDRGEWLALVLAITLLIATKGINVAITAVIDLASSGAEPLANVARQVAAGTVLLAALALLAVEVIVFVPRVLHWFRP